MSKLRYAKLINASLVYTPNPILHDGMIRYNPPSEVYLEHGYKPVQYVDQPEPQGVGRWNEVWTETDEAIVQGWSWHEATDEDEISDAEAMNMLLGGDSG